MAFVCVPNTPHVNVVPIPIKHGSARQRYPDVLATNGKEVWLIEVEPQFTESVARNIATRFTEKRRALEDHRIWKSWRDHVERVTGCAMPAEFSSRCSLIVCVRIGPNKQHLVDELAANDIRVTDVDSFAVD